MSKVHAVLDRVRRVTASTVETLKKELRHIEEEKRRLTADLDEAADHLRETLQQLGHRGNGRIASRRAVRKHRSGKRIRRTPEQLKREAEAIIDLVKSKGTEGASGPEIRKHHAKIGPDIKGFVHKYCGKKLKSTGAARSMRYFAS